MGGFTPRSCRGGAPPLHPMGDGLGGPDATPSPARGPLSQPRPSILSCLSKLPSPTPKSPLWGTIVGGENIGVAPPLAGVDIVPRCCAGARERDAVTWMIYYRGEGSPTPPAVLVSLITTATGLATCTMAAVDGDAYQACHQPCRMMRYEH
eukprot:2899473-Pleurochrysis_carterae.AAC.1